MSAGQAHVVVVSDRGASGERADATGPRLVAELAEFGHELSEPPVTIVPDDEPTLVARLRALVADPQIRFVVTTGGTGAAPRDRTPEATRTVIERELPGFGETMRARSLEKTPFAMVSRAIAGVSGETLILNLPGSPKGAVECLGFVARPARHVLDLIAGAVTDCVPPEAQA